MKTSHARFRFARYVFSVLVFAGLFEVAAAQAVSYDFFGDGKADFAVYEYESGAWHVRQNEDLSAAITVYFGGSDMQPVPGDFNGDGEADLALYHEASGLWFARSALSDRIILWGVPWGGPGFAPVPGDYNGDGKTDLALYHEASGLWFVRSALSDRIILWGVPWGGPGFASAPGDYNGDGKTDLALYHKASGLWFVRSALSDRIVLWGVPWGGPEFSAVPGDYDGSGISDLSVFHKASGLWFARSALAERIVLWEEYSGGSGFAPVPADYNGDGRTDPAVYHRDEGVWYFKSGGGDWQSIEIGSSRAAAIPSYNGGATEGLVYVAFGDSITYGSGSGSDGPETGYPAILRSRLGPAFGGHFIARNEGVPGETTSSGLSRLDALLALHQPDVLLLMEGTNDQFFQVPYDRTEANLRAMVQTALNRGVGVVIATIPPVISNRYRNRQAQMARIQAFNPRIYAIAADYGIPVARVYESITAVPGWASLLMDQPTANHPNDAGYQLVADAFFRAMEEGINQGLFY